MKSILLSELRRKTVVSIILYTIVFAVLFLIELWHPSLAGKLLQWHLADGSMNWAFIVGIPASILGTAYVLTIKNPQNYTGFYLGVVMSVLLAIQFYLQGNIDLMVLYLFIFIPFQLKSLVDWRKTTICPRENTAAFTPTFLDKKGAFLLVLATVGIVALDYAVATWILAEGAHVGNWGHQPTIKLLSGLTIAASFLANYLMIYKKNDSWICWVWYSIFNIILFILLGNIFSIVLFCVMFIVNLSAQVAWLGFTKVDDFGWAGSRERIENLMEQRNKMLLQYDGQREIVLQRQEQWFLAQLERNRQRQAELLTRKNRIEVKFGHIVDVVNRRIFDGEIEIQHGKITRISPAIVPNNAPYILPGFIDSHVHIESTLLTPEFYARMAVEQGTIGVITDPHEIANVLGVQGVEYMINSGKKVNFHFHFAAPSCVPATPFENAGAVLNSADLIPLLDRDEVYGLGEMMNVPGVLNKDPEVMAKIAECLKRGKVVDGHAPGLMGEGLSQYHQAGIDTDHECTTIEEARARVNEGMYVQVREGSAACDFEALYPIIGEAPDHVMLCSDDKYPDDLQAGYINAMCRRAVAKGIDVMDVLTAACVTPVRYYGLQHGLLQVGDPADFIMVDNLREFNLSATYINGKEVCHDGIFTDALIIDKTPLSDDYPNHFVAQPISVEDIHVTPEQGQLKVIATTEGSLLTKQVLVTPKIENGNVVSDTKQDVLKLVCLSRHAESKPVVGFIQGFGLKQGAIASTIDHDAHNIIALGVRDEDIVRAINAVIEYKGALVVTDGNEVVELTLPVAGLMSARDGDKVARRHVQLKHIAERIGCRYKAPFMTLAFMSLSVIPELKLTDKGLFDGTKFEFTSLWQK